MRKVLATAGLIFLSLANVSAKRTHKHTPRCGQQRSVNHDAQVAQNQAIDRLGLTRIRDEKELRSLVRSGELVPVFPATTLAIDYRLPLNRRYLRPWTEHLLTELSAAFTSRFGQPLILTSAVRTMQVQRRLLRWNRNAAPIHGDAMSSHLTGATFDLSRRLMSAEQNEWMRAALLAYTVQGRVIYLEETVQPCYHVFVMPPKELP
jgi:hypothetical protein